MFSQIFSTIRALIKLLIGLLCVMFLLFFTQATQPLDRLLHAKIAAKQSVYANTNIILIKLNPRAVHSWSLMEYEQFFKKISTLYPQAVLADLPLKLEANHKSLIQILQKIPNLYFSETAFADSMDLKSTELAKYQKYTGDLGLQQDGDGVVRQFSVHNNSQTNSYYLPYLMYLQQLAPAGTAGAQLTRTQTLDQTIIHGLRKLLRLPENRVQQVNYLRTVPKNAFLELDYLGLMNQSPTDTIVNGRYIFIGLDMNEDAAASNIQMPKDVWDRTLAPTTQYKNDALKNSSSPAYLALNQKLYPSIELHAQAFHGLIEQQAIEYMSVFSTCVITFLIILITLILVYTLNPRWLMIWILAAFLCTIAADFILMHAFKIWFAPVTALILIALIYPFNVQQRMRSMYQFMNAELQRLQKNQQLSSIFNINPQQSIKQSGKQSSKQSSLQMHKNTMYRDAFSQNVQYFRASMAKLEDMQQFIIDNLNGLPDAIFVLDLKGNVQLINASAQAWLNSIDFLNFDVASANKPSSHRLVNAYQKAHAKVFSAAAATSAIHLTAQKISASDKQKHLKSNHFFNDLAEMQAAQVFSTELTINWQDLQKKCSEQQPIHLEQGIDLTFHQGCFSHMNLRIVPTYNRHHFVVSYLCILHDFTDAYLAEQQRDETMHFLSHDMRGPQSSIIASIQMQKKFFQQSLLDKTEINSAQEIIFLDKLEQYAQKTLYLAEEFVQMSKAESKKYHFEESNLATIALNAIDDIWPLANKKHIQIHQTIDEDTYVLADAGLIARVLINLLSNAVKYSFENRHIWVEVLKREDLHEKKTWVDCTITDEGPGINVDNQKKLFERYVRFTDKQATQGVGLGLVFVKTVIEGHQGQVSCQSQEGRGSAFKISLLYVPDANANDDANDNVDGDV